MNRDEGKELLPLWLRTIKVCSGRQEASLATTNPTHQEPYLRTPEDHYLESDEQPLPTPEYRPCPTGDATT